MNDRLYSHCVWYAFGQQDAGIGKGVDVAKFAENYVNHALDSQATFVPSIQDAWRAFITDVVPTGYVQPTFAPRAENERPTS